MRSTLFYIPETCFGLPLLGWGLGLGLLIAGIVFVHVYQHIKHHKITDIGNSFVLLGIGGIILIFVLPSIAEPNRGIPIRGYGFCLLIAIFSALTLVIHLAKRQNITAETVYSLCFWAVITGIIGARLFYVTEYWREMLRFDVSGQLLLKESFISVINVTQGGLVVFGSILGGTLGCVIFMIRNKLPILRTFDVLTPGLMLGIAIGRIGCLLNGCCFGGVTDVPWGIVFPAGSPAHIHQLAHGTSFLYGLKFDEQIIGKENMLTVAEVQPHSIAESLAIKPGMVLRNIVGKQAGAPMVWSLNAKQQAAELLAHLQGTMPEEKVQFDFYADSSLQKIVQHQLLPGTSEVLPVHPTQIYSSCLALLLCGILLLFGKLQFYRQRTGLVFASFMILYSAGRFCIEVIRTDEDSFLGTGLTVSQNVSLLFGLAGIVLFVYLCRKKIQKQNVYPL